MNDNTLLFLAKLELEGVKKRIAMATALIENLTLDGKRQHKILKKANCDVKDIWEKVIKKETERLTKGN